MTKIRESRWEPGQNLTPTAHRRESTVELNNARSLFALAHFISTTSLKCSKEQTTRLHTLLAADVDFRRTLFC